MSKHLDNDSFKRFYFKKKEEIELSLRRELTKEEASKLQEDALKYFEELIKQKKSKYFRRG